MPYPCWTHILYATTFGQHFYKLRKCLELACKWYSTNVIESVAIIRVEPLKRISSLTYSG